MPDYPVTVFFTREGYLKKNQTIVSVVPADTLELANPHRYRVRSLPATGALIRAEDEGEQMTLL